MREIKFRAYQKEKKEMIYATPLWQTMVGVWFAGMFAGNHPDDLSDLMQFTGLKDKNGREIYEGDIVKATEDHQGFIMCVIWDEQDAGWRVNYVNGREVQDWLCMYRKMEVIGNIYENPELVAP